jgi:type IV secretion system protein VirB11
MLEEALGATIGAALAETSVTEIMANPDGRLWVERQGEPQTCLGHLDVVERTSIIRLAASLDDALVNREHPSVDVTLPGGQRFHGSVPPRVKAPYFTIRTHQQQVLTRADYVPTLCPADVFDRLLHGVLAKEMILIVGMMSSGKSTLMTTLVGAIPAGERLVTVGDVHEVRVSVPNQVALFASPSRLHEAIEEAWRSNARRVLVEEIRNGPAALAALDVWMGLKGGMCTFHGKSAVDALHRLDHLCQEVHKGGDFRPRIGSVIDLVVYLEQVQGRRQVCEVLHVEGWDGTHYVYETLFTRSRHARGAPQ